MATLVSGVALAILAAWLLLAATWWRGLRRLPVLVPTARAAEASPDAASLPSLAVVVAARDEAGSADEAEALARAARSWAALVHPHLEIVVVDDRSRDATAEVLTRALGDDPRVRRLQVDELPDGWLGKVHAQAQGVAAATASWVLLTDADVRLHPDVARVALGWAEREALDHVALLPRFEARTVALRAFVAGFALSFTALVRPWEGADPRSSAALGIGAFGLYRREALDRAGGLAVVRARPDDDVALARAVKAAGGRSGAAFGTDLVAVTWYPSLAAAVRGLEKNTFAGLGYRPWTVVAAVFGLLVTNVAPFVGVFVGPPAVRFAGWGVLACCLAAYGALGRRSGHPAWFGLFHPFTATLLAWALVRSTVRALATGHVTWRGRRYPLVALRAAQREAADRERRAARRRSRA